MTARMMQNGGGSGAAAMRMLMCGAAILPLAAMPASANPKGGLVVGGSASISSSGNETVINQSSNRAIINWRSFSIDAGEKTRFVQPGSDAIALNRVIGKDPSVIQGQLQANGNVWIVNRNGVLFGPSAQVDVHGIVASTADIADADFLNDRFDFSVPSPDLSAEVVNKGRITFGQSGLAALVAPHARNEGTIVGKVGQVVIAGLPTFSLDLQGDGLIRFGMARSTIENGEGVTLLAENKGDAATISVDGGLVLLTADAAEEVVNRVINAEGIIEAKSIATSQGEIVLQGGANGTVTIAGRLNATGGTVEVQGRTIASGGPGQVTAGVLALASTATASPDAGNATLKTSVDRLTVGVREPDAVPFANVDVRNDRNVIVGAGGEGIVAGSVRLRTPGTVTVGAPIKTTAPGNGIVIVADRFNNAAGPAALNPGQGRFLVYTVSPDRDTTGGLAATQVFNATYASQPPENIGAAGNVFAYSVAPPFQLTPEQIVQATQVGPGYVDIAQGASVAALVAAAPPKTTLFTPPADQKSLEGDVLFSNDGNHALWGMTVPAGPGS